jgi:hypothetical protein
LPKIATTHRQSLPNRRQEVISTAKFEPAHPFTVTVVAEMREILLCSIDPLGQPCNLRKDLFGAGRQPMRTGVRPQSIGLLKTEVV